MQEKQVRVQNRKVVYDVSGEGPAIVLLHGFGEDGTIWRNQLHLFPSNKLIVPDLPGSGRSEMIPDMSMEGLADAIREVILHENAEIFYKEGEPHSVIMIGHSMGGYILLALAEKHPDLLRAFGLFHSSAFADSEEKISTRRKGIDFIRTNGADAFLKTAVTNLFSEKTKRENPALVEEQLKMSVGFQPDALAAYYEGMIKRPDRVRILKETPLPVLFILGRHDAAVPVEDGLKQCHLPQLSQVQILEDSGHLGMLEEKDKSNKTLLDFVNTVQELPFAAEKGFQG